MSSETFLCFLCLLIVVVHSKKYDVDCNDGGFYIKPDPKSCSHFYKCDNGKPVRFKCPQGLHFNPKLHVCDWPRNVKCKIAGSSSQGEGSSYQYDKPDSADRPDQDGGNVPWHLQTYEVAAEDLAVNYVDEFPDIDIRK